jgi:hypothetical protein
MSAARDEAMRVIIDDIVRLAGMLSGWVEVPDPPAEAIPVAVLERQHDLLRTLLLEHESICGCTPHKPCATRTGVVQWIREIAQTVFREEK